MRRFPPQLVVQVRNHVWDLVVGRAAGARKYHLHSSPIPRPLIVGGLVFEISWGLPPDPSSPRLGELCLEISEPSSLCFCSSSCYSLAYAGEVLSRFCRCRVTRGTAQKGLCTLLCRVIILCGTHTTCWVMRSSSLSAWRSLVISGWSLDPSDSIPSLAQRPWSLMVLRRRRR